MLVRADLPSDFSVFRTEHNAWEPKDVNPQLSRHCEHLRYPVTRRQEFRDVRDFRPQFDRGTLHRGLEQRAARIGGCILQP
jgi:hypothetical protein